MKQASSNRPFLPAGRLALGLCLSGLAWNALAAGQTSYQFDFGPGRVAPGCIQIMATNTYSDAVGYGFEPGATVEGIDRGGGDPLRGDFITSDRPFYFSLALPEGNYRVTVTLGDADGKSTTTVKAELRRLMLQSVHTSRGQFLTRTFTVNIRTPEIAGDGEVRLKSREETTERWAWDHKLTLEFNDSRPCVSSLEISPANDLPTVYILGDSTVCDQPSPPWNSWGQMLPRFLKPDVVVANEAESGETLKDTLGRKRLDKVLSTMKAGDYLFIQFGHNDMKDKTPDALATYRKNLKLFIDRTRQKGGTPVLITSMERKAGVEHPTLEGYPEAVREVAKEENTTLIDLNVMSLEFYRALGPDLGKAFQDGTHHNNYGSYELAQCIVEGIKRSDLPLAKDIVADFKGFDPNHPDPVATFEMPVSPGATTQKPLGN